MSELAIRDEVLELNYRQADGLTVELLYHKLGNEVLIHFVDDKQSVEAQFPVNPEMASDAFQHPWPYYGEYLSRHEAA